MARLLDQPSARAPFQKGPADPPQPGESWTSLEITPASFTLKVGGTYQLQAVITNPEGEVANAGHLVAWSSSDAGVAEISARGRVRGVARGDARLTALYQGKRARALVTVVGVPDDEDFPEPEG